VKNVFSRSCGRIKKGSSARVVDIIVPSPGSYLYRYDTEPSGSLSYSESA
jgi:hypothetical protein